MPTLEYLQQHASELEVGQEYEVGGNWCKHCRSSKLGLRVRLEATDGALASVQLKTAARTVYVLGCRSCGRESQS